VCLSARSFPGFDAGATDHHVRLGAAIELFHLATLLHDDVIDKAPTRRGRPTVNAKWGDDAAILFADYLYATSFDLALSTLKPETLRILSKTTQKMTEGEFLQIERRGDWLSVADYMDIITKKTAYLFGAAAGLGAVIAEGSPLEIERMGRFGLEFGIAFQITDDALDYEAQNNRWGKRVGADLAEGKQTLPLLHALESASEEDREALLAVLGDGRDFATVQAYVSKYKTIDFSLQVAADHCRLALEALEPLGAENEAAGVLRRLADGVVVRQY
jgi:octaprenyl-diphosphate synthase